MAYFLLASFPNSRVKPRPSTTVARTNQVQISDYTQPLTKVAPLDLNRTYVILSNLSNSTKLYYVYANDVDFDPSVTALYGVEGQMVYNPNTNTLYEKQDEGTNTNWAAVDIEDVGEVVSPLQNATLDSPQSVYAAADSNTPVMPPVLVGTDQGSG